MRRKVYLLTTGGTIAFRSRENGTAVMDFSPENLVSELGLTDVDLEVRHIMKKGSMDIIADDWQVIAGSTADVLCTRPQGVVILHGTDTMHYTASALSFMLQDLSVPVVLTGSMIPGGDAGTDAGFNLKNAVTVAAYADLAEVCIVFSGDLKMKKGLIIRGCRARKMHSYGTNAFESINIPPIGYIQDGEIIYSDMEICRREERQLKKITNLNPNVVLVKLTPTITLQTLARFLEGNAGAVLEGTGIGHIRTDLQEAIASFKNPTAISTQTIYGGERLGMYDVDKSILNIKNIIPTSDMNSETALVKLMWALAQHGDIRSIMLKNIAGEISEKENLVDSINCK